MRLVGSDHTRACPEVSHLKTIAAPRDGIIARQRDVKALVEFRVPFELDCQQIDDVERGANDSDWQPAKDAAQKIAYALVARRAIPGDPARDLPLYCVRLLGDSAGQCPKVVPRVVELIDQK